MNAANERPRLFLIDGHSYIYRAYYAIRHLSNSRGMPTNAIYGFTMMLQKIVRERKPDYLAVAFDSKGKTMRHEQFEAYKAQRPEMPDALQKQIPYIQRMVEAHRIPVLIQEGVEADDLIGTLARRADALGFDITIVSGDKDMFQLITPHTRVYDTLKEKVYEEADVRDRFGVGPEHVADIMGLMGDAIDNIPGVPGIGEKTAVDLIRRFGSIENLMNRLDELEKPKLRETLLANAGQARMSRELATIKLDCPVEFDPERFRRTDPDSAALVALARELEFGALLKQLEPAAAPVSVPVTVLDSEKSLKDAVETLRRSTSIGLAMFETVPEDGRPDLLGISLADAERSFYLPLGHRQPGAPPMPDIQAARESLGLLLSNTAIRKISHDIKALLLIGQRQKLPIFPPMADTMIASYLLNPNRRDHSLETAVLERSGGRLTPLPEALTPEVPVAAMAAAGAERLAAVLALDTECLPLLAGQGMLRLFEDIEIPLAGVLADMETVGFKLDVEALKEFSKELEGQISVLTKRIHGIAGSEFNLNSPKQLAEILFGKMGLKPIKKTKTGFSTNEDVLQQLALQHELPAEILNYRQLTKLKSTYVDALPELADPLTRRLHTSLNQTVAATGRLSSSEPNLQNIPIKGDAGRRLRRAFIAEAGFRLLAADYNQVELRILAHLSEDETLTAAFRRGEDVHKTTAAQIFGLPPEQITPEMRRTAKTVNFSLVYGISPFGLSSTLGVTQAEAKRYIDRYFELYHGVQRFMEQTLAEARKNGYVTTLFGRRRPIPELASEMPAVRGLGERAAINTPVQGTAADLIKMAMIRIAQCLKKEARQSRMLLQIHDELIFEVPDVELEEMKRLVREEMEGVLAMAVPLKVDIGVGDNWSEAHG